MAVNPWKTIVEPIKVQNLSEIMSEEVARSMQIKEDVKFAKLISERHIVDDDSELPTEVIRQLENDKVSEFCDSDYLIAQVMQCQFDKEYDEQVKRVEKKCNGESKVSVSYDKYRTVPEDLIYDSDSEDDLCPMEKKHWDRFETNEKEFASFPKCGYKMKEGGMVTKHDSIISGRRNACRVMAFPPEFKTGDGTDFDMKLPNSVFNSLKAHARCKQSRRHKMLDRKESQATATMGVDEKTKLIMFKLVNNGMLEKINGVISTGKESVVIHAESDPSYTEIMLPKECAIKVFKTTLSEFKTRDKYIEADYRFKDRFSKQNPRKIVHMWAEKEMHNMMRMQKIGLNCPDMVCLKKHVLVMSFIGSDGRAAPKLKDVILKSSEWASAYEEVVVGMHKLYNEGHLIHADLSEYNILYHDNKCWFIDVSQSVEPDHPNGLEFLLRDCRNMYNFFHRKGVENVQLAEDLFKSITGIEEIDTNLLEGVRSKTISNCMAERFEVELDDDRNISYPFEYIWEKSHEFKQEQDVTRPRTTSQDSEPLSSDEDDFDDMWVMGQRNTPTQEENTPSTYTKSKTNSIKIDKAFYIDEKVTYPKSNECSASKVIFDDSFNCPK